MFITFEGPNGVGKTAVVDAVAEKLSNLGFDVLRTKEPTKSPLGEFLRDAEEFYSGECLACIAAADRYLHIEREIVPALSVSKIVLSDRYVESSLVLQRMDGCTLDFIWELHSRIPVPDLSVILVAEPAVLNQRLMAERKRLSRFERNESREKEVRYYREAAEFISQRGFNVFLLANDVSSLEENANRVVQEIQKLYDKGKEKKL
ncbi:MAG: dTMP kinase [Candidatus Nealsonbacteria bacterium]